MSVTNTTWLNNIVCFDENKIGANFTESDVKRLAVDEVQRGTYRVGRFLLGKPSPNAGKTEPCVLVGILVRDVGLSAINESVRKTARRKHLHQCSTLR